MNRMTKIVEHVQRVTCAHRAEAILKELPETVKIDSDNILLDPIIATPAELRRAAECIENEWAQQFAPLVPFETLSAQERARWEGYAVRNCSHLLEVPEGHVEALYVENHGETPIFIQDQEYEARKDEETFVREFPRFTKDGSSYIEEYSSIEKLPVTRLRDMGGEAVEFSIPCEARIYSDNSTPISLRKGRAWQMRAVLIDGVLQSFQVLDNLAWKQGAEYTGRAQVNEMPNLCYLVEVWNNNGDDGHMQYACEGYAVMTQAQFAEYLTYLAKPKWRASRLEAQAIMERFSQ